MSGCSGDFLGCSNCSSEDWLLTVLCPPGEKATEVCISCERVCNEGRSALSIVQSENNACIATLVREATNCKCREEGN